jgi:hypothetical protein
MKNLKHWLPLLIAIAAFWVGAIWGGDFEAVEINIFDWLQAIMAVGAAISIRYLVPEDRVRLRVVSMVVAVLVAFGAISWLMTMCIDPSQVPATEGG